MKPRLLAATLLVVIVACALPALAGELVEPKSDVSFPERVVLETPTGPADCVATGVGLRKKWMFKVYAVAHYIQEGVELGDDPAAGLVEADAPKQLHLYFLRNVGGSKIAEALDEGMEKVLGKENRSLDAERKAFLDQFGTELREGDFLDMTYIPGRGLVTTHNDKEMGVIEGYDFAHALWSIYFGEKPANEDMKKGLLSILMPEDED